MAVPPARSDTDTIRLFANPECTNGAFQQSIRCALRHELRHDTGTSSHSSDDTEALRGLVQVLRTKMPRADDHKENQTLFRGLPTNVLRADHANAHTDAYQSGRVLTWSQFTWVSTTLDGAKLAMTEESNGSAYTMAGTLFVVRIPSTMPTLERGCWGYNVGTYCRKPPHHHGLYRFTNTASTKDPLPKQGGSKQISCWSRCARFVW